MYLKISQNFQESTYSSFTWIELQALSLRHYYKTTLAELFSSQFCKSCKSTFFIEHLRVTGTMFWKVILLNINIETYFNSQMVERMFLFTVSFVFQAFNYVCHRNTQTKIFYCGSNMSLFKFIFTAKKRISQIHGSRNFATDVFWKN